jgi:hydrogenase maturation protease
MGDDGIGIRIIEYLKKDLEAIGIEVIIGETDVEYCLSQINNEEFLIIVDSSLYGTKPGTVTVNDINTAIDSCYNFSQHQMSLIKLLHSMEGDRKVRGVVIGIEVFDIKFSIELSRVLETKFEVIAREVYKAIVKGIK